MRYLFGFLCVCALGMVPLIGCSETTGDGGSGGTAGNGGSGGMPECQIPEDCDDGEECTTDACADGMCEYTPLLDGTACDESNECATGMCASGECDTTPVADDTACGDDAGTCQDGSCEVACTEQGILDAVAAGGGPYTFDCDGPTTLATTETILIDTDVILDGEGNLAVDLTGDAFDVIRIDEDVTAEIRGFHVSGSKCADLSCGAGIAVYKATFTLANSTVSGNWTGVRNTDGTVTLLNSTVSGNLPNISSGGEVAALTVIDSTISDGDSAGDTSAGGIRSCGAQLTMLNSTVSGNEGVGISHFCQGEATLTNCTLTDNATGALSIGDDASVTLRSTIVDGDCTIGVEASATSKGYNIESPGNTCGFDQATDQVGVTAPDLDLGSLADNGGPTETHALGAGSVAIDAIPEAECEVDIDQRGEPRPENGGSMCDVGSFEFVREPLRCVGVIGDPGDECPCNAACNLETGLCESGTNAPQGEPCDDGNGICDGAGNCV